jgi:hypothetical protein
MISVEKQLYRTVEFSSLLKCGYIYHDAQDQLETSLPFQLVDSVTGKKLTNETASLQVPSTSLVDFHIYIYIYFLIIP